MTALPSFTALLGLLFPLLFILGESLADIRAKQHSSRDLEDSCIGQEVSEADVMSFIESTNQLYFPDARPRRNSSDPVIVNVSLTISGIKDFKEQEGTLILNGYLSLEWSDDFLQWNTTFPYNCQNFIVTNRPIWRPDITLSTSSRGSLKTEMMAARIYLLSYGWMGMYPHGQISTNCDLVLTMFPFDTQECKIYVDTWVYDNSKVRLRPSPMPFTIIPSLWTENRQWKIIANSTMLKTVRYVTEEEYDRIIFTVLLRRKPLFYHINIIMPSIVISVVQLVIFALPEDEVWKLSISFTCLLAYSVFQGMIVGDMPRSGDYMPLLSLYITLQMSYIGGIAILGDGFVLWLSFRAKQTKQDPPSWILSLSRLIVDIQIFRLKPPTLNNKLIPTISGSFIREPAEGSETCQKWMQIAKATARISMVLYSASIVATPIIMFKVLPAAYNYNDIPYNWSQNDDKDI